MANVNGEKCVVCNAYLFEDDDVVYCPECGAPHHRDCYSSFGHCGVAEHHGTENQYKKPEPENQETKEEPQQSATVTCGMCGEKYDADESACPECNAPNVSKMGGRFVAFDFLGGVPAKTDLGNGVTAEEAKKFVVNNTHRYIPKFLGFKQGKRASWNWLAFLTPCGWLMSRKMYLSGSIIGAVQIAFTMLMVPFNNAINQLDFSEATNYMEYSNIILENLSMIGQVAVLASLAASFLDLILRVIIAVFGDFIYKNRVISKVSEIKLESEDKAAAFRKLGGVSIIAGILGYFAVSELPSIIAYLSGML